MSHKLSVIVHENDEVTVRDERGVPVVCRDCRHSGWLTEHEFRENEQPTTCLHHSGGADPLDGDRVIFDDAISHWQHRQMSDDWRKRYPLCFRKNHDGQCGDFVRAKPALKVSWWRRLLGGKRLRDAIRRRMRL